MRILVTGGCGFIGSNFIRYMLSRYGDCQIVNLDKLTYAGNPENLADISEDPRYMFIWGDITYHRTVMDAMTDCDWVVNFAAESHVDRSITHPDDFIRTNVLGTHVLLECAKELGVSRFHQVSTDEVCGSLSLDNPEEKFSETTPYNPHSPYSASKASADHLVRAYHDTYSLNTTISNCSNNYGPNQFPEKVIPFYTLNALRGEKLPVYGEGKAVRDYLYVQDHCEAIDLILFMGKSGETYFIGGDSERNTLQVAHAVLSACGVFESRQQDMIKFVAERPGHDMRYAIDHSKITKELGWQPTDSFEEGIKTTVEWYIEHEEWWQKIISGEYLDEVRKLANA